MAGLVPAIHADGLSVRFKAGSVSFEFFLHPRGGGSAWMAGTSPAMTAANGIR